MTDWQPIETAPKGGGAELTTDPNWIEPPDILLVFGRGIQRVGRWDWYYAEGGRGFWESQGHAWIEPTSGEILALHYDPPIGWACLPAPPETKP